MKRTRRSLLIAVLCVVAAGCITLTGTTKAAGTGDAELWIVDYRPDGYRPARSDFAKLDPLDGKVVEITTGPRKRLLVWSTPGSELSSQTEKLITEQGKAVVSYARLPLAPRPEMSRVFEGGLTVDAAPFWMIVVETVDATVAPRYEEAQRTIAQAGAAADMPFSWHLFATPVEEGVVRYYTVVPLERYGSVDRITEDLAARAANQASPMWAEMIEARGQLELTTLRVEQWLGWSLR